MQPLPIGISDFKKLREQNYYYVDKSLFIQEIIDSSPEVILLPRPRRFGKTLNISMVKYFFEKDTEDQSHLFHDLKIWQTGKRYTSRQGQYPVIFLTFKDLKDTNWTSAFNKMRRVIIEEYKKHSYMLDTLDDYDREFYQSILYNKAQQDAFEDSLKFLSTCLYRYHGSKVIILIDEYDIPIESGYMEGYYDDIVHFMRNLLSGGLKDNTSLEKGILTGILRVAKESIFSGLNNLAVYSMVQEQFSRHFGLLEEEVSQSLADYGMSGKLQEVSEWYNGYQFGGINVYNPWSIVKYIERDGRVYCDLKIPNREIHFLYETIIQTWFKDNLQSSELKTMLNSLTSGDIDTFGQIFKKFVMNMLSNFDFRGEPEGIYHAFVLGMLVYLNDEYEVLSNRESGYGRYDVSLIPRKSARLGVIFEFKKVDREDKLDAGADEALSQIETRQYRAGLFNRGITEIMEIGIAFYGKQISMKWRRVAKYS